MIKRYSRALFAGALAWPSMRMTTGYRIMVSNGFLDVAIGAAIVLGAALAK
jgi:hypothetical protein